MNLISSLVHLFPLRVPDFEEDEWPETLGESKKTNIPSSNGSTSETGSLKRYTQRKRCDSVLYGMAVILTAVAVGYDIRTTANKTAIYPKLEGANGEDDDEEEEDDEESTSTPVRKRDSHIGQRRDAYNQAVRDSFIEPEGDYSSYMYQYSNTTGNPHHTFHGIQQRYRPSIYNDLPIRFTEDGSLQYPSNPNTPSPRKSSRSSTSDNEAASLSLTPHHDRSTYSRQTSDNSSVFETPRTTPKTTPQRQYVKFEDSVNKPNITPQHRRSPSNTSSSSNPSYEITERPSELDGDYYYRPSSHRSRPPPVPPRRQNSQEANLVERPGTLELSPRPRQGILKYPSPSHSGVGRSSPWGWTPDSTITTASDDTSYMSARSRLSPGSTPPHIEHQKTLLDIDVEGQDRDSTRPIPSVLNTELSKRRNLNTPRTRSKPSIQDLEREFLS